MKLTRWSPVKLLLIAVSLMFLGLGQRVEADEGGFAIKPILPANQRDSGVSYFDLTVTPGQQQDLKVEIYNSEEIEQTFLVTVNPGITNDNGIIDYSPQETDYSYDQTLEVPINTFVTTNEAEVKVPAKGSKEVTLNMSVPEKPFDGIIIGAVYVTKADDPESEAEKNQGSMQIKNKIAYSVGLVLKQTENPVEAELELKKVFASQEVGRNVVKANIQNTMPINLEEISYDAKLYQKGAKEILHERSVEGFRMAPNSNFNYQISWGNQRFKAGNYRLVLAAESKATGQKWNWDEDFTITSEEAKKLNEKAIDLEKDNSWIYWLIAGIVLLLVIIMTIIIIIVKRKKKKEELKKRRKSQSKRESSSKKRRKG